MGARMTAQRLARGAVCILAVCIVWLLSSRVEESGSKVTVGEASVSGRHDRLETDPSKRVVKLPDPVGDNWKRLLTVTDFRYDTDVKQRVIPEKLRHRRVQYVREGSDAPWQPVRECEKVDGVCFFYNMGVFTPALAVNAMEAFASEVLSTSNGGRRQFCSTRQLDEWNATLLWRNGAFSVSDTASNTPVHGLQDLYLHSNQCRLPSVALNGRSEQQGGRHVELLGSWLAAAKANGQPHPIVVFRGDSLQHNMIGRWVSLMRGLREHHDRGTNATSYIVTNYRDVHALPTWQKGERRVLPSKLLRLDEGERILLELLYVPSRGEGMTAHEHADPFFPSPKELGVDDMNGITAAVAGTMKWDHPRSHPDMRVSPPLHHARHVHFFRHMFDVQADLPAPAGTLFFLSGQEWNNPKHQRFYSRMRRRNKAYMAMRGLHRILTRETGNRSGAGAAVAYIDYNYLIRLARHVQQYVLEPTDGLGHFSCLLRLVPSSGVYADQSDPSVSLRGALWSSKARCPDDLNRAGIAYMTAYVASRAAQAGSNLDVSRKSGQAARCSSQRRGSARGSMRGALGGGGSSVDATSAMLATSLFAEGSALEGELLCSGWADGPFDGVCSGVSAALNATRRQPKCSLDRGPVTTRHSGCVGDVCPDPSAVVSDYTRDVLSGGSGVRCGIDNAEVSNRACLWLADYFVRYWGQ